jgi:hypothetical protein
MTGFEESELYIDRFNSLLQLGAWFAAIKSIDLSKLIIEFLWEPQSTGGDFLLDRCEIVS